MGSHGPHFDEFKAQSGEHHGGALFDEFHGGPAANAGTAAVTQTYRDVTADGSGHGPRWDEFAWQEIPEHHGRHFDSDFTQPCALEGEHGSWMDVFRGGATTQVRAVVDGLDVQATVIACHPDHVQVELSRPRHADGGGRSEIRELGLYQIREWRRADTAGAPDRTGIKTAHPGNTPAPQKASAADAPSAHSSTAHGGPRSDVDVAAATGSVTETVKTAGEQLDVGKVLGNLRALAGLED